MLLEDRNDIVYAGFAFVVLGLDILDLALCGFENAEEALVVFSLVVHFAEIGNKIGHHCTNFAKVLVSHTAQGCIAEVGDLFLGCSAVFLLYGLDPSHYYADRVNTAVVTAAVFLLLCMLLPLIWALGAVKTAKQSIRIEAKLLRTAPAAARVTPAPRKNTGIAAARAVLLVAALGLLVYGFVSGGTADVLTKAVNICTECIGLG